MEIKIKTIVTIVYAIVTVLSCILIAGPIMNLLLGSKLPMLDVLAISMGVSGLLVADFLYTRRRAYYEH